MITHVAFAARRRGEPIGFCALSFWSRGELYSTREITHQSVSRSALVRSARAFWGCAVRPMRIGCITGLS